MQVIALTPHSYGGRFHQAGEEYTATTAHAKALTLARLAKYADRQMVAEPVHAEPAKAEAPYGYKADGTPRKRPYQRRDMQTE